MESRAHPRFAHAATVTVHAAGSAHAGQTTNVSRGGLCADLPVALAVGSELAIDLQLEFDNATQSEPLRLPARVVWCTELDGAFQIGLAFRPLAKELAEYLTLFLRYLDDGTRAPRARRESSIDKRFG